MPYFTSPDFLNRTLLFVVALYLVFHSILNKGKNIIPKYLRIHKNVNIKCAIRSLKQIGLNP